jgi:hypothetical protein
MKQVQKNKDNINKKIFAKIEKSLFFFIEYDKPVATTTFVTLPKNYNFRHVARFVAKIIVP